MNKDKSEGLFYYLKYVGLMVLIPRANISTMNMISIVSMSILASILQAYYYKVRLQA